MILELVALGLAGIAAYGLYKHYTLVQVTAEVAKIEAEAVALEPIVKTKVLAIVAALKAKL